LAASVSFARIDVIRCDNGHIFNGALASADRLLLYSVQHPIRRVTEYDSCHARGFIEFLAKPSPFLPVFHFVKRSVNRLAENLSDALLGRTLRAMMRYASAKFRHYRFKGFLVCLLHCGPQHEGYLSTGEASSAVEPNRHVSLTDSENLW
jgi:hypothetical protein